MSANIFNGLISVECKKKKLFFFIQYQITSNALNSQNQINLCSIILVIHLLPFLMLYHFFLNADGNLYFFPLYPLQNEMFNPKNDSLLFEIKGITSFSTSSIAILKFFDFICF